jgi:acetolactate synthase-1/2/3 large subunit
MIHVYDMLARTVAQEGTGACFALMGDANMNFATRLSETGCNRIYVRQHCPQRCAVIFRW